MRCWPRTALALLALLAVCGGALALDRGEIRIATPGGEITLEAELARTPVQRQRGLMWRGDFGRGDAMLFVFPAERPLAFWMKNTPVSLDIVFFNAKGHWLNTASGAVPFSLTNHHSRGPGRFVLELAAGEAERLGIGAGSRLVVEAGW